MKRKMSMGLAMVMAAATLLAGCGTATSEPTAKEASEFKLARNVDFYVSSSAGGNSDMFSRTISDIATSEQLVNQPIVVTNQVDGQGQVARRNVAASKNPNEALLCLSSGDLTVMITVGGLSLDDFRPIAIMGADKHLVFSSPGGKFETMEALVEAAKNGDKIVIGGTSGDERTVFNLFLQELGAELANQFSYVVYGSSSESITALLGGHVDMVMGKPAAAKEYVLSGDIKPILALSNERFTEPFEQAPILSELGYENVEFPLYRGVVGAGNMSDEALAYWSNVMEEISKSDKWNDYLSKNLIVPGYLNLEETTAAYKAVEKAAAESLEKAK